jgi:hypothetical protein
MRLRVLGLAAFAAGVGTSLGLSKAEAQLFFNYSTVYSSSNSSASSSLGQTAFVPDNPVDLSHPFLTVTPNGGTGVAAPSNVNLITMAPTLGTLGMTDTQTVLVNQDFAVQFNLAQSDAAGKQTGNTASGTYKGTITGFLKVNQDTVTVVPNPSQNPTNLSLKSGTGKYDVSINGFASPGIPGQQLGSLAATVIAEEFVSISPEPGSLALLFGVAVPGTLFALRLRRRRR